MWVSLAIACLQRELNKNRGRTVSLICKAILSLEGWIYEIQASEISEKNCQLSVRTIILIFMSYAGILC